MDKYFIFFFHIYQPPWQDRDITLDMYENSYMRLIRFLEKNPSYKITLNITGSLTEQLVNLGKTEWIDRIRHLVRIGQIELVGSAMYHPILPLIPEKEVKRQIQLNEEFNSKYFKEEWFLAKKRYGRRGFYLPESAYSPEIAKIIKEAGFDWISADQTSVTVDHIVDHTKQYIDEGSNITLVLGNQLYYKKSPEKNGFNTNPYILLLSDGEYALSNSPDQLNWQEAIDRLEDVTINFLTVGEYLQKVQNSVQHVQTQASNWQITKEELLQENAFNLWNHKDNHIHGLLWKFMFDIISLAHTTISEDESIEIQAHLDKALSSCTWWWADGRIYGYNPSAIIKGLDLMMTTVRAFKQLNAATRIEFERRYADIIFEVWKKHWERKKEL